MKAIKVSNFQKTKYYSTKDKALAYLQSRSYDGNVYDYKMDVIDELYIAEHGTSYYIKNNTEEDILDVLGIDMAKEEYKEYNVEYITIE